MLRLSEIYTSLQGEGPRVGMPTVFVRFAGCNLRCPGWPCDTQHAIDPKKYRHAWSLAEVDDLLADPQLSGSYPRNICLTGGEPLIQPHDDLVKLVGSLWASGKTVEMFTNGTRAVAGLGILKFIMDWKLPGSGEDHLNEQRIKNIAWLRGALYPYEHAVKFVMKDWHDFNVAREMYEKYLCGTQLQVFFGRVWDTPVTDAEFAEAVLKAELPWRLNVQTHNYVWKAHERRR